MIEGSNVEPILELEQMILVHRAYEQTSHFIEREDDRIRKVIDAYVV
ncbi:MAG: flagellar basal body rod C-terminal domain-containing protein [Hyphomicrobiales bacterium]